MNIFWKNVFAQQLSGSMIFNYILVLVVTFLMLMFMILLHWITAIIFGVILAILLILIYFAFCFEVKSWGGTFLKFENITEVRLSVPTQ